MGLAGVSWTRHGESVGLRKGGIEFESLFLVTLTRSTIRAREAAVQDSDTSVYKMHEKDSEHSVYKMHEGWEMEDRRKMEDGRRVWAVGGRVAHGLSPPPPSSLWRAGQRSRYRMEKGRSRIARRPVGLTGISLTGNTSARHDAGDKTGSGRASYSVGRAWLVARGTSPRLTRTSYSSIECSPTRNHLNAAHGLADWI